MVEKSPPSQRLADQWLDAVLPEAAFDGWNDTVLKTAADQLGLTAGERELAAPDGVSSLLSRWAERSDKIGKAEIEAADLSAMKIREKIAFGVKARVLALAEHKDAAQRAAHALAAPWRAGLGPKILWNAADAIWSAIGDTSTDGNWYSKRLVLSGVIASVMNTWLAEDDETAWQTLDARIDNVMQFEKFKAQARDFTDKLPDPLDILKLVPRKPF